MQIRPYRENDATALFDIFQTAIHTTAAAEYTPAQITAWAPPDRDPADWARRMAALRPWVLTLAEQAIAYASLDSTGYIDHFFVHGHHARQGAGALLMAHTVQLAQQHNTAALTADVSRTAQPFFARDCFCVVEQRMPVRAGVAIPNALMRKPLTP